MTKLEEEIKKAIVSNPKQAGRTDVPADFPTRAAIAAAEVAKKYIERAWNCSYGFADAKHFDAPSLSQ
jgi:hypothetical protein